jgi:predicted thioesterase
MPYENEFNLEVGLNAARMLVVHFEDTAKAIDSGNSEVVSTPTVIALMEQSAVDAVKEYLPEGFNSVGTMVNINHIAATPVGMTVTAYAELVGVDGRKLIFKIMARNERELVSEGFHERFIVDSKRFIDKAYRKEKETEETSEED